MLKQLLIILVFAAVPALLSAQDVYRWVDENGETHHGNMVPPEYRNYGWERIGPSGVVLERVERALTPAERDALRQERIREAEIEAQQRSQESRDRLLLAAYRDEQDLLDAMELQVASIDRQRATMQTSLNLATGRFESLVRRAAQTVRDGGNVSAELTQSIEEARSEIAALRSNMSNLVQQEREIRDRFTAELERYRRLSDNSAG